MKREIRQLIMAVAFLIGSILSAGPQGQEHGGGFAFAKTSRALLEIAKADLVNEISDADGFTKNGNRPIDRGELMRLIQRTHNEFGKNINRVNPETGEEEPLMMNWGKDAKGVFFLEALQPYFIVFAEKDIDAENIRRTKMKLIHEAAHVFGYKTDKEAAVYTDWFMAKLPARKEKLGAQFAPMPAKAEVTRNPDGSVNVLWPQILEFEGGLPVPISMTSDPNGLCKFFGFKSALAMDRGEGAILKSVVINERRKLTAYRLLAESPEYNDIQGHHMKVYDYNREVGVLSCVPKDTETDVVYPAYPSRVEKTGYAEGVFTLVDPYVLLSRKSFFAENSTEAAICRHLGFREGVEGSLTKRGVPKESPTVVSLSPKGNIAAFKDAIDEKAVVGSVSCKKPDPIQAAMRFAETDMDPNHRYGGDQSIKESTELVVKVSDWKDFKHELAEKKKSDAQFEERLKKEGLEVSKLAPKSEDFALVAIDYLDCENARNYLAVDLRNGKVFYLVAKIGASEEE